MPQATFQPEAILEEVIELPEIEIRKVLAGEIVNRQLLLRRSVRDLMVDDNIEEAQELSVFDYSPQ